MKTLSFEKFRGLQIQANSFQDGNGTLEKADNVVISRDNIIQKRRGFRSEYYMPQSIIALADYAGSQFAIGDNIYRLDGTATGTAYTVTGTQVITVRRDNHGLENGYVTDFLVTDEDFVAAYANRYADFAGQNSYVASVTLSAAASGSLVVVTQNNHGMQTGDTIDVLSCDFSTSTFTDAAITRINANSYYYSDAAASGSGTINAHFDDVFYVVGAGTPTTAASGTASWQDYKLLSGDTFSVGQYCPTLASGKNLYWGANEGLHAIETTTGPVRKAGVPPALDIDAYLSATSGGVASNSQAAYRVVFGRKDANDVVHLSSPSDVVVVANVPAEITALSYASGTGILTVTDAASIVANGDLIYLYNVQATPSGETPPDGSSVAVTGVTGTTFKFDFDDLGVAPTGVTSITYATRKTATVYASIPAEIHSTDYFYQVYRSESVDATVVPDSRYKLVEQKNLTAADLAREFIVYVDIIPLEIIQSNAELYTNATQEGEAQSNARPPKFADMALFKGYTFYADCTQYRSLSLDLIQTTDLANADVITIGGEEYVLRGDAANASIGNDITDSTVAISGSTVTVTQTAHNLATNDVIYVIASSGCSVTTGLYTITASGANAFTFTDATATGTSGILTFEARTEATGRFIVTLTEPSDTAAETIAESIDFTARSIVKACNRNSTLFYAQYVSGIDESPGKMLFYAQSLGASTFAATAQTDTIGACFSPALPTTGTSVSDFQDDAPNTLYASKYLEAEAVPIVNRFPVGSEDDAILRVVALRDSLILFKEDGIFRLNGDSVSNFSVTALDTTVILKATRSVAVLNNSVYALTNQGVVQVTDSSVRIISRPIEPLLTGVIGDANIDAYTAGVAYESERLYLLTTIEVNTSPSYGNTAFCYNYLTDAWTTWSENSLAYGGLVSSNTDKLNIIKSSDQRDILRERKNQNKIDYTGMSGAMQVFKKRMATFSTVTNSATVSISVPENHGVFVGDTITVDGADNVLAAAFTASIDGAYTVTAVTDKIISFTTTTSAIFGTSGTAYWNRGLQRAKLLALVLSGTDELNILAPESMLSLGESINIDELSTELIPANPFDTLQNAYPDENDVLGYRKIKMLATGSIKIRSDSAAAVTGLGYVYVTDKNGIDNVVTAKSGFDLQAGEALVSGNRIYKIQEVQKFKAGYYILTLSADAGFSSVSLVYWHDAIQGRVRFAPITMGTGQLKQFAEFQAWFRNQNSCSQLSINFATDSRFSDKNVDWNTFIGTPEGFVSYGGWGSQSWGTFPWGGGTAINLEYGTGPAVPLRTWIPQNSYLATFLQPELVHKVAGEALELQSIAIIGQQATQKVSK